VGAEDAHSVISHLSHARNRELPLVLGQLPVLPEHYWSERDFSRTGLEPPLGSRPYRIGQVRPGRTVTFERVTDYWAADLPVRRGRYNLARIVVDYYRVQGVALEACNAGQFDFNEEFSAKNSRSVYDSRALSEGRIIREEIPNRNTRGMQGLVFNLRHPYLQDVRVRKAIALLFDFEWANSRLFHGAY